ncbi:axotactin-like [Tubulanus polymorphus]|uniref:axotactin-like n=1 Tax=Tubulanus polymorphus TaxID=672921 RepID=UPI003DA6BCD9
MLVGYYPDKLLKTIPLVGFLVLAVLIHSEPINGFTFLGGNNTYIQYYPEWSEYDVQVVSFRFRTWKANAVLLHHSLRDTMNTPIPQYFMHVSLRGGELQILHAFQQYEDALRVGKGLNKDEWHEVLISKDPQSGNLSVFLDGVHVSKILSAYVRGGALNILTNKPVVSQALMGGFDDFDPNVVYNVSERPRPLLTTKTLVGCLDNIKFGMNIESIQVIPYRSKKGVQSGCISQCRHNPCLAGGQCINEYTRFFCDCLGTDREGNRCEKAGATTITLQGYDWISYDIYASHEQAHSPQTRITMQFRTRHPNGVLFYAGDSYPIHNHIALSIQDGQVHVSVAFADKEVSTKMGMNVDNNQWHNLTIVHNDKTVDAILDDKRNRMISTGRYRHLYLNPIIYIGGGDRLRKPHPEPDGYLNEKIATGLKTRLNFVGCLRNIYFNHQSVLEELILRRKMAQYHGKAIKRYCSTPDEISASFTQQGAIMTLPTAMLHGLIVEFQFRTIRRNGLLLMSKIIGNRRHHGYVEIVLSKGRILVQVVPYKTDGIISQTVSSSKNVSDNKWHRVKLDFSSVHLAVEVDYTPERRNLNDFILLETEGEFYLGSDPDGNKTSFVGCIRGIKLDGKLLEMREIVHTSVKDVILDNCNLRDYCEHSSQCQHGSTCLSDWYEIHCDCGDTGYEGTACHFSKYMKSCEEYYLSGMRTSSIRRIDLDGNGPLKPSYVQCEMGVTRGKFGSYAMTSVDHNLYKRTTVRSPKLPNIKKIIDYRDMDLEMLNMLSNSSKGCEQNITYKCWKAPIRLGHMTWMVSASGNMYSALGAKNNGQCGCHSNYSCVHGHTCSCDAGYRKWMTDFGTFKDKSQVPVTEMIFIQDGPGVADVTLGPLKCYGTSKNDKNEVAFGKDSTFLVIPGWSRGDLSFWFRTTKTHCTLVKQRQGKDDLTIKVFNETTVLFNFTTSAKRHQIFLKSHQSLNDEVWHQVALQYDQFQLRAVFGLQSELRDLVKDEKMVKYKTKMTLGGSREDPSFEGCFRTFEYNGVEAPLSEYVTINSTGVGKGCYPWCKPNPCKYGGRCVEYWNSFKCICAKPASHYGEKCETNIDQDMVTFLKQGAYLAYEFDQMYNKLIQKDITISFRTYHKNGLLFYAHDELNNFMQLTIIRGTTLRYTYNVGIRIHEKNIPIMGLDDGTWKQLVITQHWDWLDIYANSYRLEMGVRRLRLIAYSSKPFIHEETVIPPRTSEPFKPGFRVYLGGVPKTYLTSIPQFIGCIRGFKLGSQVFNLSSKAHPKNGTHPTCVSGCDFKPCKHGSVCTEKWLGRYQCNCTGTSYIGKLCDAVKVFRETAALFDGYSTVSLNLPRTGANDLGESMKFAFSSETSGYMEPYLVVVEGSGHGRAKTYLALYIDSYGGISAKIFLGAGNFYRLSVKGSFNDGHRHKVSYSRVKNWITFTVDDKEEKKQLLSGPFLLTAKKLFIGGYRLTSENMYGILKSSHSNYTGCISNFQYWEGDTNLPALEPLRQLFAEDGPPSNIRVIGNVQKGQCAKFAVTIPYIPTTVSPLYGIERYTFPPWPFRPADTVEYIVDNRIAPVMESDNTPSIAMIIAAVLIVIMILIATIIALLLRSIHRNRKKKEEQKQKEYEKLELFDRPDFTKPPPTLMRSRSNFSGSKENEIEDRLLADTDYLRENGMLSNLGDITLRPSMLKLPPSTPMSSSIITQSSVSHIASMEDLTDIELELMDDETSPSAPRRHIVPVDHHADHYMEEPYLPLVQNSPQRQAKLRKKRSPSSISEVLAEMEKLNRDLPNLEEDDNKLWMTPNVSRQRNNTENTEKSEDLEWDPHVDSTPLIPMSNEERGRNTGTEYGSMDLSNDNNEEILASADPRAFQNNSDEIEAGERADDNKRPGSASTSSSSGIYCSNKGSDYEMLDRDTDPEHHHHHHHHHHHNHPPHHHHHNHHPRQPTEDSGNDQNRNNEADIAQCADENTAQPTTTHHRHRDPRIYDILNNPHIYETML